MKFKMHDNINLQSGHKYLKRTNTLLYIWDSQHCPLLREHVNQMKIIIKPGIYYEYNISTCKFDAI